MKCHLQAGVGSVLPEQGKNSGVWIKFVLERLDKKFGLILLLITAHCCLEYVFGISIWNISAQKNRERPLEANSSCPWESSPSS